MNISQNYCQYCGAALKPGMKFCEQCGAAVPTEPDAPPAGWQGMPATPPPPEPSYSPEPATPAPPPPSPGYTPPPPPQAYPTAPPVQKKKGRPCLIIALVILALIVCIGVALAAAILLLKPATTEISGLTTPIAGIVQDGRAATQSPGLGDSTDQTGASESQYLTDHSIFDNFSNGSLGWEEGSDDVGAWGYENGGYYIQVVQPEYMVWKFPPTSFQPTTAEFDAIAPSGTQGGTFGVVCHFQDKDNFDFVEIDLADNTYSFGRYASGQQSILSDSEWNPSAFLNADPKAANHIMVACDPDMITLFINNEYEDQVTLSELVPTGDLAVFVSTWNDTGPEGFKIMFDNFSAWKPIQ